MWENENFALTSSDYKIVSSKIVEFLNENNIKEFKIVCANKDYVEIIYLK